MIVAIVVVCVIAVVILVAIKLIITRRRRKRREFQNSKHKSELDDIIDVKIRAERLNSNAIPIIQKNIDLHSFSSEKYDELPSHIRYCKEELRNKNNVEYRRKRDEAIQEAMLRISSRENISSKRSNKCVICHVSVEEGGAMDRFKCKQHGGHQNCIEFHKNNTDQQSCPVCITND